MSYKDVIQRMFDDVNEIDEDRLASEAGDAARVQLREALAYLGDILSGYREVEKVQLLHNVISDGF